jgi:uncharacterized protein (TIGR02217 family)
MNFHEIRFPESISLGATGGPERRTDIVSLGSGFEQRNARWAASRRRFDAGYGVKAVDELHEIIVFFEERRGRLYGFRWKDWSDFKSCPPLAAPSPLDQHLGEGSAQCAAFALRKRYGSAYAPYDRSIAKPVCGTVLVAVDGDIQTEGADYVVDYASGFVTFQAGRTPVTGAAVTAGFEFDTPVRFDTDQLTISLDGYRSGRIPKIPIVELRLSVFLRRLHNPILTKKGAPQRAGRGAVCLQRGA